MYEEIRTLSARSHAGDSAATKEEGCVRPMYGRKSRYLIRIVPETSKCKTLLVDKKCISS